MKISYSNFKKLSKNLVLYYREKGINIKHSEVLENFSHTLGYKDFNALSAKLKTLEKSNKEK